MLEILEQKDTADYTTLLEEISADAPVHVVESMSEDQVTGYAVFSYHPDAVTLYRCEAGKDMVLFDGIVRSVLFKAAMRGINRAVFQFEHPWLVSLRFAQPDANVCEDINALLSCCGDGCK